ncbi:related to putative tartrate transporter [Ustilago trichophora]|uniref:Related to putative tartrate transporter n=1 Tax=Ustilago trichophora TaxID=86804 RepID=A0A5C3E5D3_9BASI|nr:related to putative tartrate transporter [Ustilago trichophora]
MTQDSSKSSLRDMPSGDEAKKDPTDPVQVFPILERDMIRDVDEKQAQQATVDHFGTVTQQSEEERKLVRKLDWRIMTSLWACYALNYLDRNAIAQARLNGLEKDLKLKGNQYNLCISILFVGYTVMQMPSNMVMASKKVRPSRWMCCWMMAWAICSGCTALSHDFSGLFVARLLLGIVEAPFYPGALYLLSLFYTRREIATRVAILYSANIVATASSGLIAAATFATLDKVHGIQGWKWLFIIEAVVTFCVAIVCLYTMPDHPLSTPWLTPAERELAQARIDRDTVGMEPSKGVVAGLGQACKDGRLWVFVVLQNLHLSACGFNSFFPSVVGGLGFNRTLTLVLTCPPYLMSGLFMIVWAVSSGRKNEKTWHITISMLIALVGFIISCVTLNTPARYISCFIFTIGAYAANSVILGWVSATCGQTQEKKAAALSIVNTFGNASFAYTPFLYPKSDGPKYLTANIANSCFVVGSIVCTWILRFWLKRDNDKIKSANADAKLLYAY